MPVPNTIDDLSTTAGSNSPAGSETPTEGDNYIRTHGAFIAILRDKLNGTSDTGTIKNATFSGTMAGAASWSGVQTFLEDISAPNVPSVKVTIKPSTTTRTSSASYVADDHLAATLGTGSWAMDGFVSFWGASDGTQGARFKVSFSGTTSSTSLTRVGAVSGVQTLSQTSAIGSNHAFQPISVSGGMLNSDWFRYSGHLLVTAAGVMTFDWGQSSSSASSTSLGAGSWFKFTKMA